MPKFEQPPMPGEKLGEEKEKPEREAGEEEREEMVEMSGAELRRIGFEELSDSAKRLAGFLKEREEKNLSSLIEPEDIDEIRAAAFNLDSVLGERELDVDILNGAVSKLFEAIRRIGGVRADKIKEDEESLKKGIFFLRDIGEQSESIVKHLGRFKEIESVAAALHALTNIAEEKWHYLARKREALLDYYGR